MTNPYDEAAADQLRDSLKESVRNAHQTRRPILTHLNTDTSWLLSVPYLHRVPVPGQRSRYNILIDPWLRGPQEDVAGWFSKQWHAVESNVGSIYELEDLLRAAEDIEHQGSRVSDSAIESSYIDAVVVSHEFTDHCHKATLHEVPPNVPVFASGKAARLIRSWNHFSIVVEMPTFSRGQDWRTTSTPPLPDSLGISRIVTNSDALYYHSAVLICMSDPESTAGAAEAVIYTPHGLATTAVITITTADPPVDALALLHGLHDVSIAWGMQLNLGAVNAIKAQQLLNAKFWIGTHDEDKNKSGFIAPLLRRKALTVPEAFAQVQAFQNAAGDSDPAPAGAPVYVELGNGESLLLA
ncbi:uncharacterized protein A1O9_06944 [Exophiala aquamarina CBS 119918]|uniref:Uncharacterized protein n=1 Tax=Exophiala aquamarina CBS 119918 TaxID=1182545 RepID=A0A072P9H7_9EURO|nr:uncharacterized protein A1O9_06944 [Exophiala aquamarina CBS 119918]KEF56754.1 hypothetical protein A1O9_06944 [Exophiala aquamarina CBS 119918]